MQRGSGGGSGLSRYRSAPATWLEALLESDTENEVVLNPSSPILHSPNKPPPHPSTTQQQLPELVKPETRFTGDPGLFESGGSSNFLRQQSSPAEFLSHINSDGYFSSYGIPSSLNYISQPIKRPREDDSESSPRKLSAHLLFVFGRCRRESQVDSYVVLVDHWMLKWRSSWMIWCLVRFEQSVVVLPILAALLSEFVERA
ncbi:transcription factor bHLH80 isoform X3 [Nicotiana tabacum]|uniref:Transcription factor bHLH80 isoform X3 n=1 Tax=Nicotiana tabacum TaxID=4097 RepID=A0AC58TUH2_TOBAC